MAHILRYVYVYMYHLTQHAFTCIEAHTRTYMYTSGVWVGVCALCNVCEGCILQCATCGLCNFLCVHTHACGTFAHICTCTHACTHTTHPHACTCTCTCTHMHTHMHTYTHAQLVSSGVPTVWETLKSTSVQPWS